MRVIVPVAGTTTNRLSYSLSAIATSTPASALRIAGYAKLFDLQARGYWDDPQSAMAATPSR